MNTTPTRTTVKLLILAAMALVASMALVACGGDVELSQAEAWTGQPEGLHPSSALRQRELALARGHREDFAHSPSVARRRGSCNGSASSGAGPKPNRSLIPATSYSTCAPSSPAAAASRSR